MGALKSPKCSKGHRMVEGNLYYSKTGQRACRKCSIARVRAARAKAKTAAS
jgi:hypothetical protein